MFVSKKSGICMKYSEMPVLIKMPAPVIVNQIVFCLHAFNIPHFRDNYKPQFLQIVLAAMGQWDSGTVGQLVSGSVGQ